MHKTLTTSGNEKEQYQIKFYKKSSGELIFSWATKNHKVFYLTCLTEWVLKNKLIPLNSWYKQLIDFDRKIRTEIFWAWSSYNGHTFIKWQLEILAVDKNYCLSTPLHWISKISFIPTVWDSAISAILIQPIVYSKVIVFSTTTVSKGIINFYVKFYIRP